jgi:hypothetical protein
MTPQSIRLQFSQSATNRSWSARSFVPVGLLVEGQVSGPGSGSDSSDGAITGREPVIEASGGGPDSRQDDVTGCATENCEALPATSDGSVPGAKLSGERI